MKTIIKYKLTILYFIFNSLFLFLIYFLLTQFLINTIKFQTFINVEATIKEYKDIMQDLNSSNLSLEKKLSILKNLVKYKRSLNIQGDMFIFDPKTNKIIFDVSSDCKLDANKSYLEKGKICSLFYNSKSCIQGAKILRSKKSGYFTWYFYETPEYLYFDSIKIDNKFYRIVNGTTIKFEHEIDSFKILIVIYFLLNFIIFIIIIMIDTKDIE